MEKTGFGDEWRENSLVAEDNDSSEEAEDEEMLPNRFAMPADEGFEGYFSWERSNKDEEETEQMSQLRATIENILAEARP